ncbi:MAG TPA: zinc ABC transporter substrate-binding protein [Mycobacteriales bacterium]|nr:zinc ABC transporter substrate-binding protein [Mycobacteriales bacterium]
MRRILASGVLSLLGLGLLPACSAASADTHGRIAVVAAENMYGDIVEQVGGPHVSVTSLISDPAADPHLFQEGTREGLAVAEARLVVENGLGYDNFMERLLTAAPSSGRVVLTVAKILRVDGADANPHLWYDAPRIALVAQAIARDLGLLDPADAGYFTAQAAVFDRSMSPLLATLDAIRTRFAGAPVAYTERLPGYLLLDAGLVVVTPAAFAQAIEEGNDPSVSALTEMDNLMTERRARVLIYNTQTVSPITEAVRALARAHGVGVVGMSETMPQAEHFQAWQLSQAQALEQALGKAAAG